MQSGLQRKRARLALKYANNARISRLSLDEPDWRERTARQRGGRCPGFSLEGTCAVRFQAGPRRMQCDQKPRRGYNLPWFRGVYGFKNTWFRTAKHHRVATTPAARGIDLVGAKQTAGGPRPSRLTSIG